MEIKSKKTQYHNLILFFGYNKADVETCQKIKEELGWQNFSFNAEYKGWAFSCENLEYVVKKFPLAKIETSAEEAYMGWMEANKEEIEKKAKANMIVEVPGLPLFEYQKKGVAFASTYKEVLIADEMGLGKTLQALGVIKYLQLKKVLIVCPASLKSNWAMEIKKWLPEYDSLILEKGEIGTYLGSNPIFITNYEKAKHVDSKFDLVVFDESHYLKNAKAQRTKEAKRISKNADRVILLTGTPILNRPLELVSQIDILRKSSLFNSTWAFMMRYCDAKKTNFGWDFSGASNLGELKSKMSAFTLRRVKSEVLTDLPDKLVHSTYLDMPEPQAYKKVKDELKGIMDMSKEEYKKFYKAMTGMSEEQKMLYMMGLQENAKYKSMSANMLTTIERLRQETARQKMLLLPDILEEYGDRKVVVFGTHKTTIQQLANAYSNKCCSMTGETPVDKRQQQVSDFQERADKQYIFGTLATMGVGFTLTTASDVVFVELGWTPTLHQQAEDRCYRIGQKNTVNVNYLILKDTIDEDIAEMLMNKSEVIEGAVKGRVLAKIFIKAMK
jgi:SWI/SNF-related matrix-associated actin-dependent regulator 1 of chromatin subfamily A